MLPSVAAYPTLQKLQRLDNRCFVWIQQHLGSRFCYPLIRGISASGDGWLYAVSILLLVSLDYAGWANLLYSSALAFTLELPLYLILKNRFKRHRPANYFDNFHSKISPSDEFSFPSGHTAAAWVMATQVLLYWPWLFPVAALWAMAIGISRILLGVHFPGDILAGALLGCCCSITGYQLVFMLQEWL